MRKKQGSIKRLLILAVALLLLCSELARAGDSNNLIIETRSRVESPAGSGKFSIVTKTIEWDPRESAIVISDMWDRHWCDTATARVAEMAPAINDFISIARSRGVLIVHAPSDTMNFYKDHPARNNAMNAPKATNLPDGIAGGCSRLDSEKTARWPIQDAYDTCDAKNNSFKDGQAVWTRQTPTIEIMGQDAITDSSVEIWNLFEQRGIKNVMLVGVHTNMCVVGRPFGLRNMVKFGKNAVLVRDLTDSMYNPRRWPGVDHFSGTDRVIVHIEKFICPTILSTSITGKPPFRFKDDARKDDK
jgi:nicotinamidase-related amidase